MSNKITYSSWQKDTVYELYHEKCAICGKPLTRKTMTISHKIPLSKGGDNSKDNLMLSCWNCAQAKQNLDMDEFLQMITKIYLYNKEQIE